MTSTKVKPAARERGRRGALAALVIALLIALLVARLMYPAVGMADPGAEHIDGRRAGL